MDWQSYNAKTKGGIKLIYQWKLPWIYNIPAQAAGEELSRICEKNGGEMSPKTIVDESRPETAPLHPCFEWDNDTAADKYLEYQARQLVCCIVTKQETQKTGPTEVRAFVHVAESYRPTQVVVSQKDLQAELVRNALRDVKAFQRRLETFSSLRPVKDLRRSVDRTIQQLMEETNAP